jgi:hypothetical protein|tara:strand:+ start:432 stop:1568 length:1137 start_codon:yes stop_codon:yes gene_type:complete
MAVYKLFPAKDTSLYSMYPTMNTGIDPILQISNLNFAVDSSPSVARSILQFDDSEIANVLENKVGSKTWDAQLRCFIATAQGVVEDSTLELFPVYNGWNQGTGTYLDEPITTDGAAWNSPLFGGGDAWDIGGASLGYTSSYNPTYAPQGGGSWYLSSSDGVTQYPVTQSFDPRSEKDLSVYVKSMVEDWYSGSLSNNGIIIKWENAAEFSTNKQVQPVMQYYSVDTNTIYPPELDIKWDDSVWNTGSSTTTELFQPNAFIALADNVGTFYSESVNRFRINCRPKYPAQVWSTSSLYTKQYYLPSGSAWYAVKDLDTNEYVVPFDSRYTRISADVSSSYFDIYMNGLQPERYYQILIQVDSEGSTTVYDDNYYFKVING